MAHCQIFAKRKDTDPLFFRNVVMAKEARFPGKLGSAWSLHLEMILRCPTFVPGLDDKFKSGLTASGSRAAGHFIRCHLTRVVSAGLRTLRTLTCFEQ